MPTNSTHEELIKNRFLEKFRTPLRNYYTYGFMNYASLQEARSKIDQDWIRLSNILREDQYFQWSSDRNKAAFISADSQSQQCNPFHRVYRFFMYSRPDLAVFFNTILALSDRFALAENTYSVGSESLPAVKIISEKRYQEVTPDPVEVFQADYSRRELMYKQIAVFCGCYSIGFLEEDQNVRKYLSARKKLGFFKEITTDKRNVRWKLNDLTMQRLIDQCDDEAAQFLDAVDFFSRYYALGEFGAYLLARAHWNNESIFRFKHEYFAQALNDYILIDLLKAIEEKHWCRMTQTNPISGAERELICFPLQIRCSQMNGREYLSYYSPCQHCYSSIRIDQITMLELVKDVRINDETITLKTPWVQQEITNALTALQYTWGVSAPGEQENNVKQPVPLSEVRLEIRFDPKEEYFILNRMEHEKRHGSILVKGNRIYFSIKVTDPREMRPWIRSLYHRIVAYSGLDSEYFSFREDAAAYQELEERFDAIRPSIRHTEKQNDPVKPKYTPIRDTDTDALFNPQLSVYLMVFGDVLSNLFGADGGPRSSLSAECVQDCIDSAYEKRMNELGAQTRGILEDPESMFNIRKELTTQQFLKYGAWRDGAWEEKIPANAPDGVYHQKYRTVSGEMTDLYYEVIPLTAWELRWLYTVLHDEKIRLFLSQETVDRLLALFPDGMRAINLADMKVFDRYHVNHHPVSSGICKTIISALHDRRVLRLQYISGKGQRFSGKYCPIHIEYSKRDDRFRLYAMNASNRKIIILNLDGIMKAKPCDAGFDLADCQAELAAFLENTSRSITVRFKDYKNIPDRILNEFAPWRKKCVRSDDDPDVYWLTLYYHEYDAKDILIRLMSYGPYLLLEKGHEISQEIMERVQNQLLLFKEHEKER